MWDSLHMPTPETASQYRKAGWWRETTLLDDLADAARTHRDKPAIIAYQGGQLSRTVSYGELHTYVERFAAALRQLAVRPGDVVVSYLPNLWMLTPIYLACNRIGAISSPMIPTLAERELRHVLTTSRAVVCVTVDSFDGVDYGARLRDCAPETLRHRVVVGDAAATGAVDFTEFFVDTEWERRDPADTDLAVGPDDPAMLLYTSGTSGVMKAVAHSHNTVYAAIRSASVPHRLGAGDVVTVPNYHTHMAGMTYSLLMTTHLAATSVVQDTNNDADLLLELVDTHQITWAYLSPSYLVSLLAAHRRQPRPTPSLQRIVSGSAPVQPHLIEQVRKTFDVTLHTLWGMTENGAVTVTGLEDPPDWAAHSDGSAREWMQWRIAADEDADHGRLLVRGASQCLGYLGQHELYQSCLDEDGWFDTGDLARHDGRGGIRIMGRRDDLITRASGQKVPVLEVESVLATHPKVPALVLVGYPDPAVPGADLVCMVAEASDDPPTLEEVHRYLKEKGVARVLWPDRVQFVWRLPQNSIGKVLRQPLRDRLELAAAPR